MKQRIRVVGMIKNGEEILLFKRAHDRSEAPVLWELPTGKIKFGEQPEEAMARTLSDCAGLTAESIKLRDVVTFLAPEGSSELSNLYIVYDLTVPADAKPSPRDRYTAYKYVRDFAAAGLQLSETTNAVLEIENGKFGSEIVAPRATANSITINTDGASRGNPGPSGIGYCIRDASGKVIERGGEFIGFATSRLAEYLAMRRGIERALELGYRSAHFVADSLMVVNQLNGVFRVKNQDIMAVYQDIRAKLKQFDAVSFTHVPRSQNTCADKEANLAIDRVLRRTE